MGFKGVCVASHYWVGKLISSRYIMPVASVLASHRNSGAQAACKVAALSGTNSEKIRSATVCFYVVVVSILEVLVYLLAAATILGNAAKYYNSCNDYGDMLG